MKILTKEEVLANKQVVLEVIKNGAVFIHPTDTIYGLGCLATDRKAVNVIRMIKERPQAPFSVIAPNKNWIKMHCNINDEADSWIEKLPGPYTLIMKCKDGVACNVAPGLDSLGIRMPSHWFFDLVAEIGLPIVTTSANKTGQQFMTSLENMDEDVAMHTSFIVYEGEKHGKPSSIVDLTKKKAKVIER